MIKFYNRPAFKIPELVLIYIGLPLLYFFNLIPFHKSIPLLVVFFLFVVILLRNRQFKRKELGFNGYRSWRPILLRFIFFAIVTSVLVWIFARAQFFILPKTNASLWLMIIVFYPIWSAFPQELIYRTWFFNRYRDLFKNENIYFLTNAFLFSFSHIIFRNWLALALTFIGGFLFSVTYSKSRSLLTVFVEHTLYGDFIFTVGIGQFFYMALSK